MSRGWRSSGTGGSILVIGSAAGIAAMGMEKITFGWYMIKIGPLAFMGYLVGFAIYVVQYGLFQFLNPHSTIWDVQFP